MHKETVSLNLIKWVKMLAWGTIGFNVLEGIISMAFGVAEGSISLIGFGADSFIEVGSAFVILWRFKEEQGELHLSEAREKKATKRIGSINRFFLILPFYQYPDLRQKTVPAALQRWLYRPLLLRKPQRPRHFRASGSVSCANRLIFDEFPEG